MAKYSKKLVDRIFELMSSDTYTIAEVCQMVGISEETFHAWKRNKPEFSESIKKAEEARMRYFVAEAKKSLIKKIQGYTVQEKHTTYVNVKETGEDGKAKDKPKIKEQKVVDKHFQPDTAAIIFTLSNGDPENWKNRQNNEVTGKDGKPLIPVKSIEEKKAELEDLLRKING